MRGNCILPFQSSIERWSALPSTRRGASAAGKRLEGKALRLFRRLLLCLGLTCVAGLAATPAPQPLYRDPSNTAYSGGRPLGQLSASRFPDAPKASPLAVSRGGFGRTGSAITSSAGS